MILHALRQLAIEERLIGDPDFEIKPVAWWITLDAEGHLVGIEDVRRNLNEGTKRKPKYEGKPTLVPRQPIRTSGDSAFFLVDKAEYVLGLDPAGKRAASKLEQRASLFREAVSQCASCTGDAGAKAVFAFLEGLAKDRWPVEAWAAQQQPSPNELFAFRLGLDEQLVHNRPRVAAFWKQKRLLSDPTVEGGAFRCLVTGEPVGEVALFPLIKRLPGGTSSGVALVSHNARAFESYGLRGNENATISRTAAEEAATALNRLLHPDYPHPDRPGETLGRRFVRLCADTVVCFWTAKGRSEAATFLDSLGGLLEGESEMEVSEAYRSVWCGRHVEIKEPAAFYALTLSGTQGRAIVRDWFETSLGDVVVCLAAHFADLEMARHAKSKKGTDQTPAVPLRWLMQSLAAEGRSEPVPGSLEAAFIRAAFTGIPYPFQLLQRALVRARIEAGGGDWIAAARRDARAALIKAVLNRRRRFDPQAGSRYPEVQPLMNPSNDSPGYALGMLMAVLDRLQGAALGDVNATVVDRYFAAASATPRNVFVRLLRNAQHHARKAEDADDKRNRAAAFRCGRIIDHVADLFEVDRKRYPPQRNGLPVHLDLEQQGLFVLGYHQMRHWLWMNHDERAKWEDAHPDAPRAFRWLKDPDADAPKENETAAS